MDSGLVTLSLNRLREYCQLHQLYYPLRSSKDDLLQLARNHAANCTCSHLGTSAEPLLTTIHSWPPSNPSEAAIQALHTSFHSRIRNLGAYVVCVVCAERVYDKAHHVLPLSQLLMDVRYEATRDYPPSCPSFVHEGVRYAIHPAGIDVGKALVYLCAACRHNRTPNLPKYAICIPTNWLPASPVDLPAMTMAEQDLIARHRLFIRVCRLTTMSSGKGHYALRGNSLFFPQNPKIWSAVLPPTLEVVRQHFAVILETGFKDLNRDDLLRRYSPLRVRRDVVARWLHWLREHNPLYADVEISADNLSDLPANDVVHGLPIFEHEVNGDDGCTAQWSEGTVHGGGIRLSDDSPVQDDFEGSPVASITVHPSKFPTEYDLWLSLRKALRGEDPVLKIRRGNAISDDLNAITLMGGFPYLFPYGSGAGTTEDQYDIERLAKHLHRLNDPRFRLDPRWMFVVFNAIQKRHIFKNCRYSINRQGHKDLTSLLSKYSIDRLDEIAKSLTQDFSTLSAEEQDVRNVLQNLTLAISKVPWSPSAKMVRRREIQGLMLRYGLPTYFITLTPHDGENKVTRSVIFSDCGAAQEYNFRTRIVLPLSECTHFPAACSRGFHSYVDAYLQCILKIDGNRKRTGTSTFGNVATYYGTVESQGNGTLHLHLLLWIEGLNSPLDFARKVDEDASYCRRVCDHLDTVMSVSIDRPLQGATEQLIQLFSDIPGPTAPQSFRNSWIKRYAKLVNVHYRHNAGCFKYVKRGQPKICRYFALDLPPCAETHFEGDDLVLRRREGLEGRTNVYNPLTTWILRCSNDIKFIHRGHDAMGAAYYITKYITKRSMPVHEMATVLSAVVTKNATVAAKVVEDPTDVANGLQLLMKLCVNLSAKQEIAAPMAAGFLDGRSDYVNMNAFSTVYLFSVFSFMERNVDDSFKIGTHSKLEERMVDEADNSNDVDRVPVNTSTVDTGFSTICDDYAFRNRLLKDVSLYEFACHYTTRVRRGTEGLPFSSKHPASKTHVSVQRSESNIGVPCVIPWIKDHALDGSANSHLYARFLLILFRPWTSPADLIRDASTWTEAALIPDSFTASMRAIIANLTDINESRRCKPKIAAAGMNHTIETRGFSMLVSRQGDVGVEGVSDLEVQNAHTQDPSDQLLCLSALSCGLLSSVTPNIATVERTEHSEEQEWNWVSYQSTETEKRQAWMVSASSLSYRTEDTVGQVAEFEGDYDDEMTADWMDPHATTGTTVTSSVQRELNYDADTSPLDFELVDSISRHFNLTLEQKEPLMRLVETLIVGTTPLRMYVGGPGGTGKSQIIKAIQKLLLCSGNAHKLRTMAFTGAASSLINGSTFSAMLWGRTTNDDNQHHANKDALWTTAEIVIIDEVSMVGCHMMCRLDYHLQKLKNNDQPFGGLHMLFFGDFAQLPPVGDTSLYSNSIVATMKDYDGGYVQGMPDLQKKGIGKALWASVDNVVALTQIHRQTDSRYIELLNRLRWGNCLVGDYRLLNTRNHRVLKNKLDFASPEWQQAPLITKHKATRDAWNAIKCRNAPIYTAIDHLGLIPHRDSQTDALIHLIRTAPAAECKRVDDFVGELRLWVGQKVMILQNQSVPLGIVNGATGDIVEIRTIQHPSDPTLQHATGILLKLDNVPENGTGFHGLDDGVIYLPTVKYQVTVRYATDKELSFVREQLPIIPAYAMTDYKSQGRSLSNAIIHVGAGKGKTSGQATQHTYVMFSRVKSLDGLVIMDDFPLKEIQGHLKPDCRKELKRLSISRPPISGSTIPAETFSSDDEEDEPPRASTSSPSSISTRPTKRQRR